MKKTLLIVVLLIFSAVACKGGANTNPNHLKNIISNGAMVVDVRTAEEFSSARFDGAVNIPLNEIETRLSEFGNDKTKPIVLYCRSGSRSARAKTILEGNGYTNIINGGGLTDMPK